MLLLAPGLSMAAYNTLFSDSIIAKNDSSKVKVASVKTDLEYPVYYTAKDSMRFNLIEQKMYLFGEAEVKYDKITLKANYIEFSFKNKVVTAEGTTDSTGKLIGTPEFSEGEQKFEAKKIMYNFESKKGKITDVVTQDGDSYIHGETVKKDEHDNMYIKDGKYTTCNNKENPHFYIKSSKLKIIPDDKIVTGPANLMIQGVPTPLALPFGFFPNSKGDRKSGILLPFPGQSAENGFFIKDGGYYIGLSDYLDLTLRGDIYTKGSWGARAMSNYNWRYHFNGNVSLGYSRFKFSEKGLTNYREQNDYFIRWTHNQDTKARPNSRFTANVNFGSSSYNYLNSKSTNDVLNNNFNSNVSYTKSWKGKYTLGTNLRQSQSTMSKSVEGSLPAINFNVARFYPFQRGESVGTKKWYENIGVSYSTIAESKVIAPDTNFFQKSTLMNAQKGMKHDIPVSTSIKFLKYFTLTPTVNYSERWYLETIKKEFVTLKKVNSDLDSTTYLKTDTIEGFNASRDYSMSASVSTKLYGMYQFKGNGIKAIRHVFSPNVGFTYIPQQYTLVSVENDTATLTKNIQPKYSIYEKSMYGGPNYINQGNITYNLVNNVEMKVRSKKDTVSGFKKVKLFENLSVSGYYNLFADSNNWSDVNINARTVLFERFDINYIGIFDPYVTDKTTLRKTKVLYYDSTGKILRMKSSTLAFSFRLAQAKSDANKKKTSVFASPEEMEMINAHPEAYIDFNIPWTLNLNYNLQVLKPTPVETKLVQTLGFSGDLSITANWKVGVTSGYDFINKKLSYTSLNIYRDLHCWEMHFNWVPFGYLKSYSLNINVKSSTLQDLKLSRQRSWYDLK